jgi:Fe-S oxidoreductase
MKLWENFFGKDVKMITAEQLEERSQENNSKLLGMFSRKDAYEKLLQNEDIKTILKDIEEKILENVEIGLYYLYYEYQYENSSQYSWFETTQRILYRLGYSVDYVSTYTETPKPIGSLSKTAIKISWA